MAQKVHVLIMIEDKATPGSFIPVAGQEEATWSEETEMIETSNKLTGKFKTYIPGLNDWTVSCGGSYIFGAKEFKMIKEAQRNGDEFKLRWQEPGQTKVEEGTAYITSRELEDTYDDKTTYSLEYQGSGEPKEVTVTP